MSIQQLISTDLRNASQKEAHDIIKLAEENIGFFIDSHSKRRQLNEKVLNVQKYNEDLNKLIKLFNTDRFQVQVTSQEINYDEKLEIAIRNQNYEDIGKYIQLVANKAKYAQMIANLIGTPIKSQKLKIKTLLQILSKIDIDLNIKQKMLENICKGMIQKCFKMYFEQKVFSTNKNQPTYYSDILQLYQKSFNCTFRIVQSFELVDYYHSHILNKIFENLMYNVLNPLICTQQMERSLHVIVNFKEIQQNNLLHILIQNHSNELIELCKQQASQKQQIHNIFKESRQLLQIIDLIV